MNSERYFKTRKDFREWLEKYHDNVRELWIIYYKKHTKKASIPYADAVEEAICFGWIDGKIKRIDDERYMQRFTPRIKGSKWSLINKNRAKKMIKQGMVKKSGMDKINEAKANGEWERAYSTNTTTVKKQVKIPDELESALKKKKGAWVNFNKFAPSHRNLYIHWIESAKRQETIDRRINEVVKRSADNKKPGIV